MVKTIVFTDKLSSVRKNIINKIGDFSIPPTARLLGCYEQWYRRVLLILNHRNQRRSRVQTGTTAFSTIPRVERTHVLDESLHRPIFLAWLSKCHFWFDTLSIEYQRGNANWQRGEIVGGNAVGNENSATFKEADSKGILCREFAVKLLEKIITRVVIRQNIYRMLN